MVPLSLAVTGRTLKGPPLCFQPCGQCLSLWKAGIPVPDEILIKFLSPSALAAIGKVVTTGSGIDHQSSNIDTEPADNNNNIVSLLRYLFGEYNEQQSNSQGDNTGADTSTSSFSSPLDYDIKSIYPGYGCGYINGQVS